MTWSYVLTHHWDDPDAVGRRCFVCERAATHCATAKHSVSGATELRWYCLNHGATFAAEKGIDFRTVQKFATRAPQIFTISPEAPIAKCSCGAPVRWIVTEAGKRMPCNPDGTSHFINCPHAGAHRRPRTTRTL